MNESGLAVTAAGAAAERRPLELRLRGWSRTVRRADVAASTLSALGYLAVAVPFAVFAPSTRALGLVDPVLVVAFAVFVLLEYGVAAGSAVPTQLAFVPMLFLTPLRFVPLTVLAGSLLASAISLAWGRRPTVCPNAFGACWFAVPPAVLLLLAGEQPFGWSHWPLYLGVFGAQSVTDLVQTALFVRFVNGARLRDLARVLATVYSFDALLTPIALLAARADAPYAFLALLPFTAVLHLLGRERRSRLDAQSEADRLHELAHVDDLTRVSNRRDFDRRLLVEHARAGRTGGDLSVCLLDLDRFKQYNDAFGHPAGDDLLRRVTIAWAGALRPEALLARIGGEEFGLILPDASLATARGVVERLRRVTPREITFSTGLACWNRGETIAELIGRADGALYRAKHQGRDRLVAAA
jgi:diguanylate cyclase (GGDEF)-like protein